VIEYIDEILERVNTHGLLLWHGNRTERGKRREGKGIGIGTGSIREWTSREPLGSPPNFHDLLSPNRKGIRVFKFV
jgi:hypothetical protein